MRAAATVFVFRRPQPSALAEAPRRLASVSSVAPGSRSIVRAPPRRLRAGAILMRPPASDANPQSARKVSGFPGAGLDALAWSSRARRLTIFPPTPARRRQVDDDLVRAAARSAGRKGARAAMSVLPSTSPSAASSAEAHELERRGAPREAVGRSSSALHARATWSSSTPSSSSASARTRRRDALGDLERRAELAASAASSSPVAPPPRPGPARRARRERQTGRVARARGSGPRLREVARRARRARRTERGTRTRASKRRRSRGSTRDRRRRRRRRRRRAGRARARRPSAGRSARGARAGAEIFLRARSTATPWPLSAFMRSLLRPAS